MGDEMALVKPKLKESPLLCLIVLFFCITLSVLSFLFLPVEVLYIVIGVLLIVFFLIEVPRIVLSMSILILPICWGPLMNTPMLNIPGLKISVILPLLAVLYMALVYKPRKMESTEYSFFLAIAASFTVAVIRSYPYLAEKLVQEGTPYGMLNHFMTIYLRSLLTFCFMIILASYIRTEHQVKQVMRALMLSMIVAFIFLVIVVWDSMSADFEVLRTKIQDASGMHPGYYANYFVVMVPLTLLLAIKVRWKICYVIFVFEAVGIALTFSRASYFVSIAAVLVVLILCKKYLVIFGMLLASPFLISLIPDIIMNRALTGLAEQDAAVITAGRIDSIWNPLLEELSGNWKMLLFGNGRYGIFHTSAYQSGVAYSVNNAHNILLDMVCDGGIITLGIFVFFFTHYLKKFWVTSREKGNPLDYCILCGTLIGVGAFLVKGMTDGVFWPESSNAMVYVLIGISIAVIYRNKERKEYIRQTQKD